MSSTEIPIHVRSDKKGYFDRQCPNEKCGYIYKIHIEDWEEKVSDEQVFCPMCGHVAPSDQWYTHEHIEAIREIAFSYAESYISNELDKVFGKMARSTRGNKNFQITYKPGKKYHL